MSSTFENVREKNKKINKKGITEMKFIHKINFCVTQIIIEFKFHTPIGH